MGAVIETAGFGDILREWRAIRRYSQLDLSLEAETSARHVSFLESGRAKPSRTMVLKLSDALQLPKSAANHALHAAGFAPAFPQLPADDAALAPVREAVALMLENHDPLPGVAIDRSWDIVSANQGAVTLIGALGVEGAGNLIDLLIAAGESDIIENWVEVALLALTRLRAEIVQHGGERTLERYAGQIANHPRIKAADLGAVDFNQAVIPSIFKLEGKRLSLFSTIAQFGAVQDVAASDMRVELMFAADAETKAFFAR